MHAESKLVPAERCGGALRAGHLSAHRASPPPAGPPHSSPTVLPAPSTSGQLAPSPRAPPPQSIVSHYDDLFMVLAPYLHGERYSSYGRHFTAQALLHRVADRWVAPSRVCRL